MIRLIEALNYRCLRYVKQELSDFHVLVGPNASGKTTFFDVISFMSKCVKEGLLINCTQQNILRIMPPITITKEDVDIAMEKLSIALERI